MSIFMERGAGEGRDVDRGAHLCTAVRKANRAHSCTFEFYLRKLRSKECCTLNTALRTTVFLPSVGSQVGRGNKSFLFKVISNKPQSLTDKSYYRQNYHSYELES